MEQLKSVRDRLPAECRQSFDDIIEGRVLGASRHIRMIGDMMLAVARSASEHKFADCIALAEYFKERRGKSIYKRHEFADSRLCCTGWPGHKRGDLPRGGRIFC